MPDTTPLGFRFPLDTDYTDTRADVPRAVEELATDVDDYLSTFVGNLEGKYALTAILVKSSGTSYTPSAGVDALLVECVGGGGAGGGATTGATNGAAGGGGGGGGYGLHFTTTIKTYTYAIGAGGTGVSAADGNVGGSTTFDSPAVLTATGGFGGKVSAVAAPPVIGGLGGVGGSGAGGNLHNGAGQPGGYGICLAAAQVVSGEGGGSFFGGGGNSRKNQTASGNSAVEVGGGGGGATIVSGGGSQPGGDGYQGIIRIWEFQEIS